MPRMRLSSGEVYDIPDSDVAMARRTYGAVPADSIQAPASAAPSGGDPLGSLAGMGSSALEAIGGPRTVLGLGSLGGAGVLLRRFMANRAAQPASTAAAPQAPMAQAPTLPAEPAIAGAPAPGARSGAPTSGLPSSLVELTQEDIDALPQLSNRKPGHVIRRASLERMYENQASVAENPRTGPQGVIKGGKSPTELATEYRKSEPTRPITMEGQPAKAPAPTPEGPGVGRGASGPALERRAAAMEHMKANRPVPRAQQIQQAIAQAEAGLAEGKSPSVIMQSIKGMAARQAAKSVLQRAMSGGLEGIGGTSASNVAGLLPLLLSEQQINQANQFIKEKTPVLDPARQQLNEWLTRLLGVNPGF